MPGKFWWFEGAPIRHLRQQLTDAGPAARLEVRVRGEAMEFRVVSAEHVSTQTHEGGWTNESHVCPPQCP